ncbi:SDR family NAD(P)-dependent oxidoreductase [Streptomyces sp. NBC_00582]|uniref:SDR family NAD(P)-dependent oxidoreductase n=1 Tax=Streptomyces sp. NBC_00582 TaxID=2975783 RepID=UPI00106283BD|nr:SDR family oxidoreductase [Streptomyces sp. NBC_00582]WUB59172.1 SDR family oxidoreductase [Streptomyces sp. NBC_00582]
MSALSGLLGVVTGGASGIGLATARMLSAQGADVAVLDLDPSAVPRPLLGVTADVTDDTSVWAAVTAAARDLGGIDILVNNAVGRLLAAADDPDAERTALNTRQPMGRLVTPDEVAAAIVYLASPAAASVTGTSLAVDGGMQGLRVRPAAGT